MTLVAMWERNTVTVTLTKGTGISTVTVTGTDVKTGSGTASATVYYGGAVTITATMSTGYDWVNWTGSATYTNISQSISNVTSDLSFTANGKVSCTTTTMQEFNPSNLDSGVTNLTLCDSRDSKSYTVAKINDQWWMTKNLDLAGGTTLTSSTSNVSSDYTLPASNEEGFSDDNTAYVYNSDSTTCGESSPCYSYYSYVAATAGTNPSSGNTSSRIATSDICPKGWRLPTKDNFTTLISSYPKGTALTAAPFYGVYAGRRTSSGSLSMGGRRGFYWSSYGASSVASLAIDDEFAGVGYSSKRAGYSVRCVFGSIMQNVTTSNLAAMMPNDGDTTTLMDSRDGAEYTIGKLADGKYWMLDNLRLGGTSAIDLTSSNTNMTASSWTLPAGVTSGMTAYDSAMINVASKDTTQPLAMEQSGTGKVGVYYNYCAATVGTYCYAEGSGTGDANPNNDICPKNWRMPTGGDSGEYQALYTAYSSSAANFAAALKTPLSGNFDSSSADDQGSNGRFWSSTRLDGDYMRILLVGTSYVDPQDRNYRSSGLSVRCLFK